MTLSGTSTPLTLFSERLPMRSYMPNFYHFSLSFSTWQCLPFLNLRKSVFSWFSETVASWFSCYCFDCSSALSWPLVHLDQERQPAWFLFSSGPLALYILLLAFVIHACSGISWLCFFSHVSFSECEIQLSPMFMIYLQLNLSKRPLSAKTSDHPLP